MSSTYSDTLASLNQLDSSALTFTRGIEKEGLRIQADSQISQQPHPKALGSALTHSHITTDYSEALLEFITPVHGSAKEVLDVLQQAHSFTLNNMDGEMIWPASMPGVIKDELDVPIAEYGSSNIGQLKHVYRHGLWHRYGRKMQCIAGLHYNFSVSENLWQHLAKLQGKTCDQDFISEGYFGLIRNFRRYSWLLMYLFGASPAVDKSFLEGKDHQLEQLDEDTFYLPYATSLRMSGLGYQNNAQEGLFVCFNGLPTYTKTLKGAMGQSVSAYEEIGVEQDGEFKQLNTNLLQIENEYYSDIRPKRNSKNGEKPLTALNQHGVEYIEVRCLDLNPFLPLGIDEKQIQFMDLFLAYCLFKPSPELSSAECSEVANNLQKVVVEGRAPEFSMERLGESITLKAWAKELLEEMTPLAQELSQKTQTQYESARQSMEAVVDNPDLTPSAQMLNAMKEENLSFTQWVLKQAKSLGVDHSGHDLSAYQQEWQQVAKKSLQKQSDMESEEGVGFAQFLQDYLVKP